MSGVPERLRAALAERYELADEIGQGGMATVYRARDLKHSRDVAIKVLRPELAEAIGPTRFLQEIEISAGLRHPTILPLFDSGEAAGFLYYVMPYVEGESLRSRLDRDAQLPLEEAFRITLEVADALSYAHSRGVVHRDIKPANILLESGHAIVADFGIARAVSRTPGRRLTETGLAIGTPYYMSPEQAGGAAELDGRSDLYSLAAVLYEMLAGEPPHTGVTPQAVLARSLSDEIRPLHPVRHSVTPAVEAVVRRALAASPADRYATCHEFGEALRTAAGATLAGAAVPAARPSIARRVGMAVLVGLALLAVGSVAKRLIAPPSAAAVSRRGIAVFPFRDTGGGAGEWSEALGDLLSTALDGTPGLRVADPWSLWRPLRPDRSARAGAPDPVDASRLALGAGARRFVLGTALKTGDRLDITIRIYEAGSTEPSHTFGATGAVTDLPTLVQQLAVNVISRVWEEEQRPEVRDVAGYTTKSADALKAYLDARSAMRRGMLDSAERAIDRAIALDSSFALALAEATAIKSWTQFIRGQPFADLMPLVEQAAAHRDSLSERNRLRVETMRALVRTEGGTAAAAARRILQIDSTDLDGWDLLRYANQAYGWQYGATAADARVATERVIALDSTFVPALVARAWLAVAGGDTADMTVQLRRLQDADTTLAFVAGSMAGIRAVTVNDADFVATLPVLASAPPQTWVAVVRALRVNRPERAERLLDSLARDPALGPMQPQVLGALASLWIAEGRVRHVDSLLGSGAFDQPPWLRRQVEMRLVAAQLAGVGDPAVAARAVASLEAYLPADSALAQLETRPVWRGGWLIGAYHATFGDTSMTRRWSRALERLPRTGTSEDWVGSLQSDFAARLAARRGDGTTALQQAERAYRLWTIHTDNAPEFLPEPAMRLHLGMLLVAEGRPDSAAAFLRSLVTPTTWMGFLSARAWFELAQLAERSQDYRSAADYFSRALDLWRRGGDEVADWRGRAQAGLERVTRRIG